MSRVDRYHSIRVSYFFLEFFQASYSNSRIISLPSLSCVPFPRRGTDVESAGSHETIVVELLDHVRAPTGNAGDDEQRREQMNGNVHVMIQPGAGPIDVRGQLLFPHDDGFDNIGRFFQIGVTRFLGEL